MKTLLITLFMLALPFGLSAQVPIESPLQVVLAGSGWLDSEIEDGYNIGLKTGLQVSLDEGKGMWLRLLYSRWELYPGEITQALSTSALIDWYAGKKWKFYLDLGGEHYIGGEEVGTDAFVGLGGSRRIWTADPKAGVKIPAGIDFIAELKFADGNEREGRNFLQLNIGFKFGKPIKGL